MPAELRLTAEQFDDLRGHLLQDDHEHAAILVCGTSRSRKDLLLCQEVVPLGEDDLEQPAGRLHLHVSPLALARAAKRAHARGSTLVVCHSHPFPGPVAASMIDLTTEQELCGRVLPGRLVDRPVGALILGPDGYDGRLWAHARHQALSLRVAGTPLRNAGATEGARPDDRDARHMLVWGADGQLVLRQARIAVVGAGGTGSHVVTQLAHLGVGQLLLIDPDVVELTNLNRLVGATTTDIGTAKVDVLADTARRIHLGIHVEVVRVSLLDIDAALLGDVDVIMCCTDSHGSRALLTEVAAQYLVPLVDLGVEVQADGRATRAGGGVRVIRPGGPCLHCMDVLDPALIREEFLTDRQRDEEVQRGYLRGSAEPAPSVVALNGVVASLAVLEVLDLLLELFVGQPNRILYRAERRVITTATASRETGCFVCGITGLAGRGDARPLARRPQEPRARSG